MDENYEAKQGLSWACCSTRRLFKIGVINKDKAYLYEANER